MYSLIYTSIISMWTKGLCDGSWSNICEPNYEFKPDRIDRRLWYPIGSMKQKWLGWRVSNCEDVKYPIIESYKISITHRCTNKIAHVLICKPSSWFTPFSRKRVSRSSAPRHGERGERGWKRADRGENRNDHVIILLKRSRHFWQIR